MINKVDLAVRQIFEIYFQRSFDPQFHDNCPGCSREFSPEEMEKDILYQEKLAQLFSEKIKERFSIDEIIYIANQFRVPFVARFMQMAFEFSEVDALELRRSIFGDNDFDGNEY